MTTSVISCDQIKGNSFYNAPYQPSGGESFNQGLYAIKYYPVMKKNPINVRERSQEQLQAFVKDQKNPWWMKLSIIHDVFFLAKESNQKMDSAKYQPLESGKFYTLRTWNKELMGLYHLLGKDEQREFLFDVSTDGQIETFKKHMGWIV